jgi:hypothetical protein
MRHTFQHSQEVAFRLAVTVWKKQRAVDLLWLDGGIQAGQIFSQV